MFITNGGGLIATLTYLANQASIMSSKLLWALTCFAVGLIFAIILVGIDYFVCLKIMFKQQIERRVQERINSNLYSCLLRLTIFLGISSGVLFTVGCIIFDFYVWTVY